MINAAMLGDRIRQMTVTPSAPTDATFKSKTGQGTFTSYTLPLWQTDANTKDMLVGDKLLQNQATEFRIYQSDLDAASAPDPKADDEFVDDGNVTYTVTIADSLMLGTVWNLTCTKVPS